MHWKRLYRLHCGVRHYAWGERGTKERPPFIARLLGMAPDDRPFAELWMGDHAGMSATLADLPGQPPLLDVVAQYPEPILGAAAAARGCRSLPFLFKVLSCRNPLSIQAHPDRELAKRLHHQYPRRYPDGNHKPELAVALTRFRALASFRPANDVRADFDRIPALRHIAAAAPPDEHWLRTAYAHLFRTSRHHIGVSIAAAVAELKTRKDPTPHDSLFLEAARLYPDDPGTVSSYFLNLLTLEPGEALFMPPNEPHAYLSGTILECMAASDNVVRAGWTEKPIDVDVLLPMLSYREMQPRRIEPIKPTPELARYPTPVPEFDLDLYHIDQPHEFDRAGHVSIFLVLRGSACLHVGTWSAEAPRGSVWLHPAAAGPLRLEPLDEHVEIARACPTGPWLPPETTPPKSSTP